MYGDAEVEDQHWSLGEKTCVRGVIGRSGYQHLDDSKKLNDKMAPKLNMVCTEQDAMFCEQFLDAYLLFIDTNPSNYIICSPLLVWYFRRT